LKILLNLASFYDFWIQFVVDIVPDSLRRPLPQLYSRAYQTGVRHFIFSPTAAVYDDRVPREMPRCNVAVILEAATPAPPTPCATLRDLVLLQRRGADPLSHGSAERGLRRPDEPGTDRGGFQRARSLRNDGAF
jgi:hypothetical protein